jgi:hypothetical protein
MWEQFFYRWRLKHGGGDDLLRCSRRGDKEEARPSYMRLARWLC